MTAYYDKMRFTGIKKRMDKETKARVKILLENIFQAIDELGIIFAQEDVPELSAENIEKMYKYMFGRGYYDDCIKKGEFVEKIVTIKK
jgi:flagellin-specific chaperone FliS